MENLNEQNILQEVRQTYAPDRKIGEIEEAQATVLGRNLRSMGRIILRGIYINPSNDMTVEQATKTLDHNGRYDKRLQDEHSGIVVGPRHEYLPDNNEFCPPGIAIWGPVER
jgi:hypothetical protein